MKKIRISLMACLAVIACASVLFMHSCKEDDKLFAGVASSEVTILLGESYQYNLELTTSGDASADGITAQWSVADPSIASVDENGLVTALEVGSTVVTANLSNGQYVTSMVTVEKPESMLFQTWQISTSDTIVTNVEEVFYQPDGLPGECTVYMTVASNELNAADSLRLSIEDTNIARFAGYDNPSINFNDTVIPVDADTICFRIKPYVEGVTRVYVANGNLKSYLTINVGPVVSLTWIQNSETVSNSMQVYLQDGETKLTAYAQVRPSEMWQRTDLYDYEVTQNNPDNPAALIEDFDQSVEGEISWTIKPQALGTTKMTVTSRGQQLSFVLKVVDKERVAVNAVTINYNGTPVGYKSADSTFVGQVSASTARPTIFFEAVTTPQNAAATWPVQWSSSDPSIASCENNDGSFTLHRDGEVEIMASSGSQEEGTEHPMQTASVRLIIKTDVTGISIATGMRSTLMVGEAVQYSYTTTPSGLNPEVTWHSSDETKARFDADGTLHALATTGDTPVQIWVETGALSSNRMNITIVDPIADYDYTGATYYHSFTSSSGRLNISAQRPDDDYVSDLYAYLDATTLTDGTYTIGENMRDVTFVYNGLTTYVTAGSITVRTVNGRPEFDIDLEIGLETGAIHLSGSLDSDHYFDE